MNRAPGHGAPLLRRRIRVPEPQCTEAPVGGRMRCYAGDVRVVDVCGSGEAGFAVPMKQGFMPPSS